MPAGLSYRHKVPLALSLIVLGTVVVLTAVTAMRTYGQARADLLAGAQRIAAVLAETLATQLPNDAVWAAYRAVQAAAGDPAGSGAHPVIVALDADDRVFVSSDPRRFPVMTTLAESDGRGLFAVAPDRPRTATGGVVIREDPAHLVLDQPVGTDGRLLLAYDKQVLLPALYRIMTTNTLTAALILALLLPLAWYWGQRLTAPLVQLAGCMRDLPEGGGDVAELARYRTGDEIGLLARTFERMVADLGERHEIQRQMVATDRLASVGRLAAGIAHEINNPLAGMLTAVDTFKRHAETDRFTRRTLSLLERGLLQIKDTVSALLVESRLETRALTPADIADVHTLAAPDAQRKRIAFGWSVDLDAPLPLPATQVRQMLLNLLLNAIGACPEDGSVDCAVTATGAALVLDVRNDGAPIEPAVMERLFEPFARGHDTAGGSGLGLWVTYQIVRRLDGEIAVDNADGVRFRISLPLQAGSAR